MGEAVSGLPWIHLYVSLPRHPKSLRLAELLGRRRGARAWTHVVELWLWASEQRPTGDLSDLSDETIAKVSGWSGDAGVFASALKAAGFVDPDGYLHDWDTTQEKHVALGEQAAEAKEARSSSAARMRKLRERRKREAEEAAGRDASRVTLPVTSPDDARDVTCDANSEKDREQDGECDAHPSQVTSLGDAGDASRVTGELVTPFDDPRPDAKAEPAWLQRDAERLRMAPLPGRLIKRQVDKPATPEELDASPLGRTLRAKFPFLDGRQGPDLVTIFKELWPSYEHWQWPTQAASKLENICWDRAARHRPRGDAAVGTVAAGPPLDPRDAKLRAYWTKRAGPDDLPPFHVWREKVEADGSADRIVGAKAPADVQEGSPADRARVTALLSKARAGAERPALRGDHGEEGRLPA